jgi:putative transport protein
MTTENRGDVRLNSTRPSVGRFLGAARWILIEFGLLVFNAGIGLNAGGKIVATFPQVSSYARLPGICRTTS